MLVAILLGCSQTCPWCVGNYLACDYESQETAATAIPASFSIPGKVLWPDHQRRPEVGEVAWLDVRFGETLETRSFFSSSGDQACPPFTMDQRDVWVGSLDGLLIVTGEGWLAYYEDGAVLFGATGSPTALPLSASVSGPDSDLTLAVSGSLDSEYSGGQVSLVSTGSPTTTVWSGRVEW